MFGIWFAFNIGSNEGRRAVDPGFQIHLKFAFCSEGRISVLRGGSMWNGWKKAAIGMGALLAFILLELMAVIGGVAAFLGLVMDVDLPFLAVSEE
jgi:hypothetical protein